MRGKKSKEKDELNEVEIAEVKDDDQNTSSDSEQNSEYKELCEKLEKKEKECEEYLDLLRRTKAEFDNFRKRTSKEKESIYDDGFTEGVKQILPLIDNLERAVSFNTSENDSLLQGVQMVLKMFSDTLKKMEIEEIPAEGEKFDPDFHNAVMHVEDDNYEDNVIIEVLQKGYKYKDKIVRYSMVKVAN